MNFQQNEFPNLPKRLKGLGNLSENLWWSWNPGARMLLKMLDPSVLTLGFARRFATYKRADLIFYDWDRLGKLLNDRWRPIQIVFCRQGPPGRDRQIHPGCQLLIR